MISEPDKVLRRLSLVIGEILPVFYEYNKRIKHLGLYLKPIHIVTRKSSDGSTVKYYYYGRYWYKLEKTPDGKIKWIYIGREKPIPSLPDPPLNPLEGVVIKRYDNNVEIVVASEDLLKRLYGKLLGESGGH